MVCMGNICRSPTAMAIGRRASEDAERRGGPRDAWQFDSAGTHADHHLGSRPDSRANATLVRHGYPQCKHRARPLTTRDFDAFDLVLAMDRRNLAELRRRCPKDLEHKLGLLLDFAPPALRGGEIPDPYYGSVDGFERVFELCEAGVLGLLALQDRYGHEPKRGLT